MKNVVVRAVTGAIFVAIIVVSFLRPEAMILLFALITGMTIWEYSGLVNAIESISINRFISTVAGVYLFLAVAGFCSGITPSGAVFIPYLLTVIYLFASELYLKHEQPTHDWAYTMLSQMYIALPFSTINVLAFNAVPQEGIVFNSLLPLSVFILLWVNDTGAYCCGSLFGKHKLFPRISPGKTWEGSIGGALFVVIAALLIAHFSSETPLAQPFTLPAWIGLALVVCIFGTWGDLVESLFKRTLGLKDSGHILPGHGGMLDRFDSALLAFPAVVVYVYSIIIL